MESYVIRGGREGYDRLKVLARSWAASTAALLDRVGVDPGQAALDLGCGGGDVTLEIAGRVGAAGRVVGIDMDEVKHEFWLDTYQAVLRSHGGDPATGRKRHGLFGEAGVAAPLHVTLSQRADLDDEYKHMPGLTVAATAEAIVADGLATTETVAEAVARLAEYADDPHTLVGSPRMFQIWARKPAA